MLRPVTLHTTAGWEARNGRCEASILIGAGDAVSAKFVGGKTGGQRQLAT